MNGGKIQITIKQRCLAEQTVAAVPLLFFIWGKLMEYIVKDHLHYGGIPTFNHTPYTQDLKDVDIAIMGVPFDVGVANRP